MAELDERTWWDFIEEAQRHLVEAQELLAGEPLSSDDLDCLTDVIRESNKTIEVAKRNLGL